MQRASARGDAKCGGNRGIRAKASLGCVQGSGLRAQL